MKIGIVGPGPNLNPKTALLEMRAAAALNPDPVKRAKAERAFDVADLVLSAAEQSAADIRKYKKMHAKRIFRPKDRRPKKRLEKKAAAFSLTSGPAMTAFRLASLMVQPIPKTGW